MTRIWKIGIIALMVIAGGLSAGGADAANWYVDNAASGANNGTSWANAWRSLSSVVWGGSGVKAGDTLFISGGSSSKTYTGTLRIGASGSRGAPITIRPGQEPGHNGVVIMNGNSEGCIVARGLSWITIDGNVNGQRNFRFQNGLLDRWNALVETSNMNYFIVRYCEFKTATIGLNSIFCMASEFAYNWFHDMRGEASIDLDGSHGEGAEGPGWWDSNRVHHNIFQADAPADAAGMATDHIQGSSALSAYNNIIEYQIGPNYGSQHPDGCQISGRWVKIYNNHFKNVPNAAVSMDYSSSFDGHYHVFNNIMECTIPSWTGYAKAWDLNILSSVGECGDMVFANNTVAGLNRIQAIAIHVHGSGTRLRDWKIVNNIFQQSGVTGGGTVVLIGNGNYTMGSDVVIDYNLINPAGQGGSKIEVKGGQSYTQPHPRTGTPQFVSYAYRGAANNYRLTASDTAARDQGTSMSSYFTSDREGIPRPVGSAWDIGAFEYRTGGGGAANLSPPRNLRIAR
ncbi:MAG TPA: choice-of-anchor Q domain-containing protein [Syntrophales bacterium]|nr:choice-of-anchor Q domain-containing protein [Syntrophales bacterium]